MATSSIFHNIIIDDPKRADAFVAALEASIANPYKRPEGPTIKVTTDPARLRQILDLNKQNRERL